MTCGSWARPHRRRAGASGLAEVLRYQLTIARLRPASHRVRGSGAVARNQVVCAARTGQDRTARPDLVSWGRVSKLIQSPARGRQPTWGIGAVGSALPWHGRGQGFESPMLHPTHKARILAILDGFGSGLVAVLGPGEGVGVDLGIEEHFEGAVVLDAELVVFVDVDLDEEGLVAEASVGVVAAFVDIGADGGTPARCRSRRPPVVGGGCRIPMGQCRPPGTRPTASIRPPEVRPHRRRRACARSDGSFTRRTGLGRTIDFRHEGNVTSNCSATELTAAGQACRRRVLAGNCGWAPLFFCS